MRPNDGVTNASERRYSIYRRLPQCPRCHSTRLLAQRTTRHGDGSFTRHCRCEGCGARVYVTWEPGDE